MLKNRSVGSYFVIWLKGFCMGAADVVPGVSGGTMAFILGIYEELIEGIRAFDAVFVRRLISFRVREAFQHVPWPFLLALLVGIFTAIFSLAKGLSWLLDNRPVYIWSFFFGLVLASIFTVSRHLHKWDLPLIGWLFLGAVGAYLLVGLVPVSTPETWWFLLLSGAIAICAMILPGISGSFILVLLGKYDYLLRAVNHRDFLTLALAAMGAAIGLISFVRLLNWLLKRHHDLTIAVLTGLMLGALRKVWPWKETLSTFVDKDGHVRAMVQANILPPLWDTEVTLAIFLALIGFLVVFFLNRWADRS